MVIMVMVVIVIMHQKRTEIRFIRSWAEKRKSKEEDIDDFREKEVEMEKEVQLEEEMELKEEEYLWRQNPRSDAPHSRAHK